MPLGQPTEPNWLREEVVYPLCLVSSGQCVKILEKKERKRKEKENRKKGKNRKRKKGKKKGKKVGKKGKTRGKKREKSDVKKDTFTLNVYSVLVSDIVSGKNPF